MTASPNFSMNGGASLAKLSISASGAITATLDSVSGVRSVTWTVTRTDETTTPASYTLVQSGSVGQTVDFNADAAGTAGVLQAQINGGISNITDQPSSTTRAEVKFFVPANGGGEVLVQDEIGDKQDPDRLSDSVFGPIELVNSAIRSISAQVSGPGSAVDNELPRFDGTTGQLVQGSQLTVSDSGTVLWKVGATTPRIQQSSQTSGNAADMLIVAQDTSDAAGDGGDLSLAAGAGGGTSGTGGNVDIQPATGNTDGQVIIRDAPGTPRITVNASGDITLASAGNYTVTRGGTTKLLINGTSNLQYNDVLAFSNLQTNPTIRQEADATVSATADTLSINAQDATGGGASVGGDLDLRAGSGVTDGVLSLRDPGGTARIQIASGNPVLSGSSAIDHYVNGAGPVWRTFQTFTQIGQADLYFTSGVTAPAFGHQDTGSNDHAGYPLNLYAQDVTGGGTTISGGDLLIRAGDAQGGSATNRSGGNLYFRPGTGGAGSGTAGVTEIRDSTATARITVADDGDVSVSPTNDFTVIAGATRLSVSGSQNSWGTNVAGFLNGQTNPTIRQDNSATASDTGDTLTIHAQNCTGATSTGGALTLKPGTGTSVNGAMNLQFATGTNAITISTSDVTVNNTSAFTMQVGGTTRARVLSTLVEVDVPTLRFTDTTVTPTISQEDDATGSATGDTLTIQAQNATGATSTGGALALKPGTGTSTNGVLELQDSGGTARATVSASGNVVLDGSSTVNLNAAGGTIISLASSNTRVRVLGAGSVRFEANGAHNVETLSAAKSLGTTGDPHFQVLDGGASNRNVDLPAEADNDGMWFLIRNSGSTNNLVVRDDSPATIVTLTPGDRAHLICNGTTWTYV